jgi:hypothetical protein
MQTEAGVMRTKWFFFLVFFILSVTACQTAVNRRTEITCRPITSSPGAALEGGKITVAWNPNKEAGLAGYQVYYGPSAGSYSSCVDVGNPPESSSGLIEYTLTALDKGKKYYISVIAYDKNKNMSEFSSEVSDVAR